MNKTDYTRALTTLEFGKILELLAALTRTEGAAELARTLEPVNDAETISLWQKQTSDAKRLIEVKGTPPLSGVRNILASVDRADKGATLSPRELLDAARVLSVSRALEEYNKINRLFDTVLDEIFARLEGDRQLEAKINRAIPAEDMIADEASTELSDIRRRIRAANNRIKDSLAKYTSSGAYSKYLQESIVTMRNGRYVIPVKTEYKNEVKGLVHDVSASGATLFIEPLTVVETNNELRELEGREKHEIDRILYELSALVADDGGILTRDYHNINEIAFIFAKAELSYKMKAQSPKMNTSGKVVLSTARHPLLDAASVVPISIKLGGEFDTLVITGTNTGGKTVALKTVGLLCLMFQAGLHIPAGDASDLCVLDKIYSDIGDEQSIEQSLSTFSSHMVNIVQIMKTVDRHSLVLFDELGAGTDPVEGAALAMAILEAIRAKGALCAATTHYAELKAYALETDGVENACCEFDIETLKPTYRLIIGAPGKSNAFAISQKLGLPEEIIARAGELVSNDNKSFENVIERLEVSRMEMEKNKEATEEKRREYEAFAKEATERLREKLEASEREVEKNRKKAVQLLESARASSDFIFAELDKVRRLRDSEKLASGLEDARKNIKKTLRETDDRVNPIDEREADGYVLPRPLVAGDEVTLININKKGVLTTAPDRDGNVTVRCGIMNTKTNVKNLMLAEPGVTFTDKNNKRIPVTSFRKTVRSDFKPEIDLRGKTGEEGWHETDKFIDEAMVAGFSSVMLIHGKGTGALKKYLWECLRSDSRIKSFRLGNYGEGDLGVTVAEIK